MSHRVRLLLAAATGVLTMGCSGSSEPGLHPADPGTPLASYATEGLSVARAGFCDRFSKLSIARTLGGEPASTHHYASGETVEVSPGVTDISHEFNCTFTSADGVVARGWVFAPPITADRAAQLVKKAMKEPDCTIVPVASPLGTPSIATSCGTNGQTVTFRGLFVDAWLSCSLTGTANTPASDLVKQTDLWCSAVAQAAHATFTAATPDR